METLSSTTVFSELADLGEGVDVAREDSADKTLRFTLDSSETSRFGFEAENGRFIGASGFASSTLGVLVTVSSGEALSTIALTNGLSSTVTLSGRLNTREKLILASPKNRLREDGCGMLSIDRAGEGSLSAGSRTRKEMLRGFRRTS